MFHGSSATDPSLISDSEEGFDIRFSHGGLFGQGTYFAEDPAYSHLYAYKAGPNIYQMFLAVVAVGRYVPYRRMDA